MTTAKSQPLGRFMLNNVRVAFPRLFTPEQFQGKGDYRCGAQLIVHENHPQFKALDEIAEKLAREAWKDKAEELLKKARKSDNVAWRDGNEKDLDGYADSFIISANCKGHEKEELAARPNVFDGQRQIVKNEQDCKIYSGCYVNASVEFYAMNKSFGPQINCTLRGIQFAKDGDAFGAAPARADEFEEVAEGSDAEDFA